MPLLFCFRLSLKELDGMEISRFEMMQIKTQAVAVLVRTPMSLAPRSLSLAADGLLDEWASDSAEWSIIGKRLDDGEGGHSLPIHHPSLHTSFLLQFSLPTSRTVSSVERTNPHGGCHCTGWRLKKQGIKTFLSLQIITKAHISDIQNFLFTLEISGWFCLSTRIWAGGSTTLFKEM